MKFISYSQNFEDVMLWRALKNVHKGFYVDVGAAWPDKDSVTKAFYEAGWSGINIEPNPAFINQYEDARPRDINLQIAISDTEGTADINFIDDTGLSTMHQDIVKTHEELGFFGTKKQVKVKRLETVLDEMIPVKREIHFLKIDVEGLEANVIRSCNWVKYRPWVLLIESTLPMSQEENHHEWEQYILLSNYKKVYHDGLNRYYISNEHPELENAFNYPPNVFDGFITANEADKSIKIIALKKEIKLSKNTLKNREWEIADAKSKINTLSEEISTIKSSRFWRFTSPVRRALQISHRIIKFIINYDKKTSPAKFLNFLIIKIETHPKLKSFLIRWITKFGFKGLALNIRQEVVSRVIFSNSSSPPELLSPMAKVIYNKIKKTHLDQDL